MDTANPRPGDRTASTRALLEPLECRLLLSGVGVTIEMKTVNVRLKDGTLTIDAVGPRTDLDFFLDDGGQEYALFNSGDVRGFASDSIRRVVVNGGRGGDNFEFSGSHVPVTINARGGDDRINGGSAGDVLNGGPGDDHFGSNNYGTDVLRGGPGHDRVDFSNRELDLRITLDGLPNDDHMDIGPDVEQVVGGKGNDLIVGNAFDNVLNGGPGDDTLIGGAGNDVLIGGTGYDHLSGEGGNDTLVARDGERDRINGGKGFDVFSGDADDVLYKVEVIDVWA
jgi:Ca2+-binding RTX toxin-like protein